MKRFHIELIIGTLFVCGGTYLGYIFFAGNTLFWNSQQFWSAVLVFCWCLVAGGYLHQGWMIHRAKNAANVSIVLPIAVFLVQCILFVKGVYYNDWSLVVGALLVNSGVAFNLWQIIRFRQK